MAYSKPENKNQTGTTQHTKCLKRHKEITIAVTYQLCKDMMPANIFNKACFQKKKVRNIEKNKYFLFISHNPNEELKPKHLPLLFLIMCKSNERSAFYAERVSVCSNY